MAQDKLTVEVRLEIGDTEFTVRTSDYDLAKHIVYHAAIHMSEVSRLSTGNRENQGFLAGWRVITDKIGLAEILALSTQGSTKVVTTEAMNAVSRAADGGAGGGAT